jgi:hypothetical protein
MKKSLFAIQTEYVRALQELEDFCTENQTDEVPEEIHERLSINQDELNDKLENYWYALKELNGNLDTIKNHIKEMNAKKKAVENNILRLKKYVGEALELYGEENKSGNKFYKHDLFKVTASRSSRLSVVDLELLPDEYKEQVVTVKAKSKEIKEALKVGEVDGAFIDNSVINVTFR